MNKQEMNISRLPADNIPFYDISYDPNIPNNGMPNDMPKNTATASRMCETVLKHDWLMDREQSKTFVYRTLQSIIKNYADTNKDSEVIIGGICDNYRTESYMNSCIVRGLDSFIGAIKMITKN